VHGPGQGLITSNSTCGIKKPGIGVRGGPRSNWLGAEKSVGTHAKAKSRTAREGLSLGWLVGMEVGTVVLGGGEERKKRLSYASSAWAVIEDKESLKGTILVEGKAKDAKHLNCLTYAS